MRVMPCYIIPNIKNDDFHTYFNVLRVEIKEYHKDRQLVVVGDFNTIIGNTHRGL